MVTITPDHLHHQWAHRYTFREGAAPRDIEAHLFERIVLRQFLHDDARVWALFRSFAGGAVWEIASTLAAMGDVLARECGWRDRAHMHAEPERYDEAIRENPHTRAYLDGLALIPWPKVRGDFPTEAACLVYDTWNLPREHPRERWGWLADDVTALYVLNILMAIDGRAKLLTGTPPQAAPPAIEVSFTPSPNESIERARARLTQLYDEANAALGPRERPRGTVLDEARLVRDVEWFYRNVLKDPPASVRSLASAYHETTYAGQTTASDHRATVQSGIARARRLLAEVPA